MSVRNPVAFAGTWYTEGRKNVYLVSHASSKSRLIPRRRVASKLPRPERAFKPFRDAVHWEIRQLLIRRSLGREKSR